MNKLQEQMDSLFTALINKAEAAKRNETIDEIQEQQIVFKQKMNKAFAERNNGQGIQVLQEAEEYLKQTESKLFNEEN